MAEARAENRARIKNSYTWGGAGKRALVVGGCIGIIHTRVN